MKTPLVVLVVGLLAAGLTAIPALLPAEPTTDEKVRLEPSRPNYGDGTGGGGFAIALPGMAAGDRVNVSWELDRPYAVRVIPDTPGEGAPYVTAVTPLFEENGTEEGAFNFTAPEDATYWLTLTVPEGEGLERGTVYLHWDPPFTPDGNPFFLNTALSITVITVAASAFLALTKRSRGGERDDGP